MDKVISVVIPTYNRKLLTDRAVESVKSRRPDLIELIIVDDCGTEPYSYAAQFNHSGVSVRVIRCANNGGAGLARKAGVSAASGELIAFLDSDDEFGGAWLDAVIHEHASRQECVKGASIYVGRAAGGKVSHYLAWHFIKNMPDGLMLLAGRVITVFFNPFYTPSVVISKSICRFSDLRYAQDYYTMVEAIFKAKGFVILDELACMLGRSPNSSGGLTGAKMEMFKGEMTIRKDMLKADYIPVSYKLFVPIGMIYQLSRSLIKLFMNSILKVAGYILRLVHD